MAGDTANGNQMAYVGRIPGTPVRDSDAWYTPVRYLESARRVMGSIQLDPFSSVQANELVQADSFFTVERSALTQNWYAEAERQRYPQGVTVWMNPPYTVGVLQKAIETFLAYWHGGAISQAIVLVSNATDTQWFKALREDCAALCFPTHRIRFTAPDGKLVSGNTRGQVFFYFGPQHTAAAFVEHFRQYGWALCNPGH